MEIEKALASTADDDPSSITLAKARTFNPSNGGIEVGRDTLVFCGEEYLIQSIEPCNVWNNMPNKYKLVLRRIKSGNH